MAESVYYRFTTEGLPENTFTVVRFTGEEAISELYRFRIDLLSDENDLDVDFLQDQPSTFLIGAGGHERVVQGIITDVEILDQPNGATVYRVELRPRVWELSRGFSHKVYLDTTTPDIIKQILDQAGITQTDYHLDIDEMEYREWEFRLQYGESYWNFLSRILERDGIYYYFTAGNDVEQIHFCDSARHQPAIDNPELHFSTGLGMESPEVGETVHSLITRRTSLLRSITLQNYNDAKPSTRINVTVDVDKEGAGVAHLYGQKVQDETEAKALAELRAEEMRAGKIVHHGESTVCLLAPAHRFGLDGHPRASMNEQEYQIISVEHSGYDPWASRQVGEEPEAGTPAYDNRFTAIAADTQYRHPQKTEKPTIDGTLNARVDAAGDGEYAELDEEGRYHIIFPFDTEHESGKASHWVRMMQPYAGEREGMHFPLRKGARVLISFLAGDPDLPVINGAIPNTEQPSTTTSDNHTCGGFRTPGGNWLETDDNFGQEHMNLFSSRMASAIHLGADINASGYGNSVGADANSNDENGEDDEDEEEAKEFGEDPDPQADGILFETDGMHRTAYFGGTNRVTATTGWRVTDALWADTPQQRDEELRKNIDDIGKHSGDYWRIMHSRNRIFRFPRKSPHPFLGKNPSPQIFVPITPPDTITRLEESSGTLLTSRTVGDEYSYRSGTTFNFHGIDREAFEFGPNAFYSTANHDTDSADLRAIVKDSVPDFQDDTSEFQEEYEKLMELRAAYEEKRDELAERRRRFRVLDDESQRLVGDITIGLITLNAEGHRAFKADETEKLEEWLLLQNLCDSNDPDNVEKVTDDGTEYKVIPVQREHALFGKRLTEAGSTRDGSIKEAEEEASDAREEYDDEREDYAEDGYPEWPAAVRSGRVSVAMDESYRWHHGRVYDFGGCSRYSFGGSYSEAHIAGPPAMDGLDQTHGNHDILNDWTVDGRDCRWDGKLKGAVRGELDSSGKADVIKTIGDTYRYHKGVSINVHEGSTFILTAEAERTELSYSGKEKTREFRTTSSGTKDWRYNSHGTLVYYEHDGYSTGHDNFTFEAEYENAAKINAAASSSLDISLGMEIGVDINLAVKTELKVTLGGEVVIELKGGLYNKIEFPLGMHNEMKLAAGMVVKIEKTPTTVEMKNGTLKIEAPGGVEVVKDNAEVKGQKLNAHKAAAGIQKVGAKINKGFQLNT